MSWNGYEHNNLLRNEGPGEDGIPRFVDVAQALGAGGGGDARGIAVADFDNDGDLDIAVNHNPGDSGQRSRAAASLLRNDVGNRRGWLAVELRGTRSNRDAVGAEVEITSGGLRQMRLLDAGSSYASQHGQRLYFGLGEQPRVERLTVRWPSGLVEEHTDLEARRLVKLVEGGGVEIMPLPSAPTPADGAREPSR